jgi:hypothetical protein
VPKAKPGSDAERMARAEEYLEAAREHYVALTELPEKPRHYPLAYYLAGLAVECLFRAYEELGGAPHDAGHGLQQHALNGRFLDLMPQSKREELADDLSEICKRWFNNHRYRSLSSLRRILKEAKLFNMIGQRRTLRGDIVQYNWDILDNAAQEILQWGLEQWQISKTKLNKL